MNKKIGIIILILNLSFVYAQSHVVRQMVRNWVVGYDTTGAHWYVYDLYHAETLVINENTTGSGMLYSAAANAAKWYCDVGNFPGHQWDNGDTVIAFGSWDSAYVTDPGGYGDNPNHTGFYWLFSDTLDATVDPQTFSPDDTLREMPQPLASQVNGDTGHIEISITNPPETRRPDQTEYDVLGYWVVADTSGQGTPNRYDKDVGFFPVNGGPGDITVCIDEVENYEDGQTVYWAYKLVARPDTTTNKSRQVPPGYSTYYLSMNSNPIVIIGVAETELGPVPNALEVSPNPFTEVVRITCCVKRNIQDGALKIYDATGRLIKQWDYETIRQSDKITWDGSDDSGRKLPAGIYFVQVETEGHKMTKKAILLR